MTTIYLYYNTVVYVRKNVYSSLYTNLEDVGNEIYFKCTLK